MSTILERLESWFKSLTDTAEKHWNDLPADQQSAILNGSIIPQVLKQNLDMGETQLTGLLIEKTGLSEDVLDGLLSGVYKQLNIDSLTQLQAILKATQGSFWAGTLETLAKIFAGALSGGKLSWESLGMGVLQYAYQTFVKGKN